MVYMTIMKNLKAVRIVLVSCIKWCPISFLAEYTILGILSY